MGMSTHVYGFREPTEEYRAKVAAWDACQNAGIDLPEALEDYFDGEEPDEDGMKVDIDDAVVCFNDPDACADGFEVDLSKLPPGITKIRFVNSY